MNPVFFFLLTLYTVTLWWQSTAPNRGRRCLMH
uniref:Uncharacterized protein n=1 Tax=Anguilla anguilla TaxID=7936 RepID=A0A0E9RTW3_ANGAN